MQVSATCNTQHLFFAELLGVGDVADQGIILGHMMYELEHGLIISKQARDQRMHGGYIPTALYLDARSVHAAITATFIKPPAEKSLLCHIQCFRELRDHCVRGRARNKPHNNKQEVDDDRKAKVVSCGLIV